MAHPDSRLMRLLESTDSEATPPAPEPAAMQEGADGKHTGVMVGVFLEPIEAQALALPGGEPAEDLHITLAYYGDAAAFDTLARARLLTHTEGVCADHAPLEGKVSGFGRFQGEGEGALDVFYATPDVPGLAGLRQVVADWRNALPGEIGGPNHLVSEHGWTPHITLQYLDPLASLPAAEVPSIPLRVRALTVAIAGERTEIPLRGHILREAIEAEDVTEDLTAHLAEATTEDGGRVFEVVLITAGMSRNGRFYPAAALQRAAPLFEGVACYADHVRPGVQRSVRDKVGVFTAPEYGTWTVNGDQVQGIKARLTAVDPWLRATLQEALAAGAPDFVGFSIDASGRVTRQNQGGRMVDCVESFVSVRSVDCVAEPAAGGRLVRMVEGTAADGGITDMTEEQIKALVAQALQEAKAAEEPKETPAGTVGTPLIEGVTLTAGKSSEEIIQEAVAAAQAAANATVARVERTAFLNASIAAANLSSHGRELLTAEFQEAFTRRLPEESEITTRIAQTVAYEAALIQESVNPTGTAARFGTAAAGSTGRDQMVRALHGWFGAPMENGERAFRDLREAFCKFEGVDYFDFNAYDFIDSMNETRFQGERSHRRVQESLATSTWGQVFADVAYLRMLAEYNELPLDDWKKFVSEYDNPGDFRTRHWARIGGYGDIAAVAEGAPYQPMTTPGDEEVTFAVSKRGGLDDLTWEALLGDRVNKVRQLPREMAYAAKRTLRKFVMNIITTDNPVMGYDSVALYHASHGNTGTSALSVSSLSAVKVAMRSQTRALNSEEILGIRNKPKFLIVPNEMEDLAARVINPSEAYIAALASSIDTDGSLDPRTHAGQGYEVVVYDELTDPNNWFVTADPKMTNLLIVGFLNGQETPELFVADDPKAGSAFSADKSVWKVRHVYGAVMGDHRGVYRQVVA